MKLDKWQKRVLATKGHMCICSPRQMGKSTVISEDAGQFALDNKNVCIMVIASTERQAFLLFEKILAYIYTKARNKIKTGVDRPTKKKLLLKNGSVIHCLPTGDTGYGIRGFTINRLYADEAAFIKEDVWAAVAPMLATTGGEMVLLSTPFGTENYFYRCFHDKKFTKIKVDPEEVLEGRDEPQKSNMVLHRKEQKESMTKLQFLQEYMGEFVGGIQRFIKDDLIDMRCNIDPKIPYKPIGNKYQGIDIARMGGDDTVMCSGDKIKKRIRQFNLEMPEPQTITDTARLIIRKDHQINHKKIYMDDGGLGVGVFDILFEDRQTKRKVIGLNNAKRIYEIDRTGKENKEKGKKLLGTEMAINFKIMMEQGTIDLYNIPELKQSLRSMQFENQDGVLKIYGNFDHIFEALKRLAWCIKDKTLNIRAFC